ncbi:MAG: hypothetical protein SFU20_13475 [Chitinophagaceae bacterium]|nr:hypothetical protein [Chitinophagaceae bacterium]
MSFIKKITALILLLAFMANTFNQASLVLGYHLNKAAYIKNCENKYRPELKCNGQCQLMKKLEQQRKEEQKFPELKLENKTEVVCFHTAFPESLSVNTGTTPEYFTLSDTRTFDQPSLVFHPPGC